MKKKLMFVNVMYRRINIVATKIIKSSGNSQDLKITKELLEQIKKSIEKKFQEKK